MKQIYFYDGTPYLIMEKENGEMQYPEEQWTDIEPPEGIYTPCHFDGKKWIGNTKENWEQAQPKNETEINDKDNPLVNNEVGDNIISELSLELLKTQEELQSTQKDLADLTVQIMEVGFNA